jgi:crotonobetainyl-CoA:carnitine CoA-transferase CaiB-like acyl-CoA transferase
VLDGVRVLDFGRYIAGPFCATVLADLGADVIRIERVEGGEDRFVTPVAGDGSGALFLHVNRNKRSLTLDLAQPAGMEIARRLIATADVVVANLPPQTLASMGMDYPSLCEIKPDIILVTATAFGREGPWGHKLGFDGLAQAMSGNLHLTGAPGVPTRSSTPYVDFGTASLCAAATLAALMHRDRTGEGQLVEGALLKTALAFMSSPLIEQDLLQVNREATLNRGQLAGPADVFQTRDGFVMCSVIGPYQFERWCQLVEAPELLQDPRFADDDRRGRHGELLSARMGEWCAKRTTAEALAEMEAARIPAGPVYTPQQTLDDPHVRALGFLEPTPYPGTPRPAPIPRFPVTLSATPASLRTRAPTLGEHTDEILRDLGYDAEAIAALRRDKIV